LASRSESKLFGGPFWPRLLVCTGHPFFTLEVMEQAKRTYRPRTIRPTYGRILHQVIRRAGCPVRRGYRRIINQACRRGFRQAVSTPQLGFMDYAILTATERACR